MLYKLPKIQNKVDQTLLIGLVSNIFLLNHSTSFKHFPSKPCIVTSLYFPLYELLQKALNKMATATITDNLL